MAENDRSADAEVTGIRRNKRISRFSCVYIFLAAPSAFIASQITEMSGGFPDRLLTLQMPGNIHQHQDLNKMVHNKPESIMSTACMVCLKQRHITYILNLPC